MTPYAIVRHKRTNEFYKFERFCKMRIGDTWVSAVVYYQIDDRNSTYVRPLDNFVESFEVLKPK